MSHEGNRGLQDAFDSQSISDRLEEKLTRTAFTADDKAFIRGRHLTASWLRQSGRGPPVRYTITGVNPGAGAVTTAADGTALISWLGTKAAQTPSPLRRPQRRRSGDVNSEPQRP